MRAVQVERYGSAPVVVDVPAPRVTGGHDVLVSVGGAGVCRTDLHVLDGLVAEFFDVRLPYTLGHETAGWVAEVGPEVRNVQPGDAVILHPEVTCGICPACRQGRDMYCTDSRSPGFDSDGGFAELVLVNDRAVVPLLPGQAPAEVAPLADGGLAAFHAVRRALLALGPHAQVAVIGCGGLGHIAVQLLHALGDVRVLAVDTAAAGRELAADVGADEVLEGGPSSVDAVRALTDGVGVDAVLDFVGDSGTPSESLAMLVKGGTYHVVGYGGRLEVPTVELVGRELTVAGSCVGTQNELRALMRLAADGRVRLVTQVFPLEQAVEALAALRSGTAAGRIVLTP